MKERYFHGGPKTIRDTGWILPACELELTPGIDCGLSPDNPLARLGTYRDDVVYVTTNPTTAIMAALKSNNGVVFEVTPVGEITADPDTQSIPEYEAFICKRAKVICQLKVPGKASKRLRRALQTLQHEWINLDLEEYNAAQRELLAKHAYAA